MGSSVEKYVDEQQPSDTHSVPIPNFRDNPTSQLLFFQPINSSSNIAICIPVPAGRTSFMKWMVLRGHLGHIVPD